MTEQVKTRAESLREELVILRAALQLAAGGLDEDVQAALARMEELLRPA